VRQKLNQMSFWLPRGQDYEKVARDDRRRFDRLDREMGILCEFTGQRLCLRDLQFPVGRPPEHLGRGLPRSDRHPLVGQRGLRAHKRSLQLATKTGAITGAPRALHSPRGAPVREEIARSTASGAGSGGFRAGSTGAAETRAVCGFATAGSVARGVGTGEFGPRTDNGQRAEGIDGRVRENAGQGVVELRRACGRVRASELE